MPGAAAAAAAATAIDTAGACPGVTPGGRMSNLVGLRRVPGAPQPPVPREPGERDLSSRLHFKRTQVPCITVAVVLSRKARC